MNPIRLLDDLANAIFFWIRRNTFMFWFGVFVLIFAGPLAWTIITDLVSWYAPVTPGTASLLWLAGKPFGG